MKDAARQLSQALIDAGKDEYTETYSITDTSDEVVVTAIKLHKMRAQALRNTLMSFIDTPGVLISTPGAPGNQCPTCNGSGRI